jgi:hypothetical protein
VFGEGPKNEYLKLTAFLKTTFGKDRIIIINVELHGTNVVGKRKMGV